MVSDGEDLKRPVRMLLVPIRLSTVLRPSPEVRASESVVNRACEVVDSHELEVIVDLVSVKDRDHGGNP